MSSYVSRIITAVSSALEFNAATLSGAMDVIVIKNNDTSPLHSTPFHVRFGKLRLLKSREKEVKIQVNGQETEVTMKLGLEGEAYFVQELAVVWVAENGDVFPDNRDNDALLSSPSPFQSQSQTQSQPSKKHIYTTLDTDPATAYNSKYYDKQVDDAQVYLSDFDDFQSDDEHLDIHPHANTTVTGNTSAKLPNNTTQLHTYSLSQQLPQHNKSLQQPVTFPAAVDYLSDTEVEVTKSRRLTDHDIIDTTKNNQISADLSTSNPQLIQSPPTQSSWFSWASFSSKKADNKPTVIHDQTRIQSQLQSQSQNQHHHQDKTRSSTITTSTTITSNENNNTSEPSTFTAQSKLHSHSLTTHKSESSLTETEYRDISNTRSSHAHPHDDLVFQMDEDQHSHKHTDGIINQTGTGSTVPHESQNKAINTHNHTDPITGITIPDIDTSFRPVAPLLNVKADIRLDLATYQNGASSPPEQLAVDLDPWDQLGPSQQNNNVANLNPSKPISQNLTAPSASSIQTYSCSLPDQLDLDYSLDSKKKDSSNMHDAVDKTYEQTDQLTINKVRMSLCAHLITPKLRTSDIHSVFEMHKVSSDDFLRDPDVMYNPNLLFKIDDRLMSWDVAAPAIISMVCFGKTIDITDLEHQNQIRKSQEKQKDKSMFQNWFGFGQNDQVQGTPLLLDEKLYGKAQSGPIACYDSNNKDSAVVAAKLYAQSYSMLPPPAPTKLRKMRRMRKSFRPTTEQLNAMNLKPGVNSVTFRVTSALQGTQEVSSNIYLWDEQIKIVISDIDGTITRSDVLGHLLPRVGKDWSQAGVAGLYTRIAKNGYNMMYLTSRPIGQACSTRLYINSVNQAGYKLPQGPIIMSPDRLVASLTREVIRRKPQEFKIAALRDIRLMFPPDYNPFYAGFGNRNTDAISYRANGILPHRIFTVNSYGDLEVMNSKYEAAASYTTLKDLVESVFVDVNRKESLNAVDASMYNDFRFWRTDLPKIEDLGIDIS